MTLALVILAASLTACALVALGWTLHARHATRRPRGQVLDFTRRRIGDSR